MKKPLILFLLFFFFTNALFGQLSFKLYPGVYIGGNGIDDIDFSIGGDVQLGLEFGEFDYDDFIFGIHFNGGFDTGVPNQPNLYYGGLIELYFGDEIFFGVSAGAGYNKGIDTSQRNIESLYFRFGLPLNFFGKFKTGLYFDWYPDVGSRLGFMMHLGIGGS